MSRATNQSVLVFDQASSPSLRAHIGFRIEVVICVYDKSDNFPAAFQSLGQFAF